MTDRTRLIKDFLWFFALLGLVAGVFRMWFGLGATTNLTDGVPWGLWKILNMVGGVALSTSGFTVGFLVYVLKIKKLKPLMKPAILLAFLGYGCSMLALLFDIGLPHRFWHPIVMWNEHSFLFEVFWCVMLYFTVTSIELLPTFFERFRVEKITRILHGAAFSFVIIGISLSSLHHSSLGSLFLVTPQRLHPLWYSSWLPLFFILSAMGAGIMFLILIRILYSHWYDPESVFGPQAAPGACPVNIDSLPGRVSIPRGPAMPMLSTLASVASGILGIYLVLKVVDLFRTNAWTVLTAGTWESWLYALELSITAVLPLILVLIPKSRRSPVGLGVAAFSAAAGLALNRLDAGIFGYFRDAQEVYFPSGAEWAVGIGVIAAAGLAFFFIVENFGVFDDRWRERFLTRKVFAQVYDRWTRSQFRILMTGVHRVTLIIVFAVPMAWIMFYPPFNTPDPAKQPVEAATGIDVTRTSLRIDGNRSGFSTEFNHVEHQKRLGGDTSCVTCHHVSIPGDKSTPCSRCHRQMTSSTDIFRHTYHIETVAQKEEIRGLHPGNYSCRECHGTSQAESAENAKSCFACHEQDMWPAGRADSSVCLQHATSFREAMHGTCITCHREKAVEAGREHLAECSTCHHSLRARPGPVAEQRDHIDPVAAR